MTNHVCLYVCHVCDQKLTVIFNFLSYVHTFDFCIFFYYVATHSCCHISHFLLSVCFWQIKRGLVVFWCALRFFYIHTYIIGHYNPSVRIIDLVSHTTHVVCVTLRVFARNLLKGNRRRNTFRIFFWCRPRVRTLALRLISQHTTY